MTPEQQRNQQKRANAQINFMKMALRKFHPNWEKFPIQEMREIEAYKGDDSNDFESYAEEVQEAYWMIRNIEIAEGKFDPLHKL